MNFGIILSQNQTPIFKYIVWVLGKIMEGIFFVLDKVGIPNIGLAIIIFTIVVNLCLLPLTYKQQKFSKLSQKINPEIKAIQKKYEGKKDQASQLAMNGEVQEVYGKYGISPTGSCLFLIIQMPILFALYRVIYQMPGYVAKIKDAFYPLVENIAKSDAAVELVKGFKNSAMFAKQFDNVKFTLENTIIDCLNRASTADFQSISDNFSNLSGDVEATTALLTRYNNFLGLNIGNTPWFTMKDAFANGAIMLGIGAILIPLLAGVTQWLNVKLSPQPQTDPNDQGGTMASSMKMMNYFMPLMSVWFCFTLPAGMGLYWIASAVIRGIIMVVMNKRIDKMDFDKLIAKNSTKNAKKIAKRKAQQEKLAAYASMNTKKISNNANSSKPVDNRTQYEKRTSDIAQKASNVSSKESPASSGSSGGMMAKANAVKNFNEKNNK
ncbi:MAG: YidC/Oxa1 family membrane protein insertase [Lachnospiraceae bacterium]|nr:YidC/Oxa1 family membrane protein insertase [Lachnospiraceae bacterium]